MALSHRDKSLVEKHLTIQMSRPLGNERFLSVNNGLKYYPNPFGRAIYNSDKSYTFKLRTIKVYTKLQTEYQNNTINQILTLLSGRKLLNE